jgi:CheY-like chemotaxis protein
MSGLVKTMHLTKHLEPNNVAVKLGAIRRKHLKILIVDDEERFRRSMCFYLRRKYEAQVKDVASGQEAVEALKSGETFDVIFLDLMMPEMSGTQTYAMLKRIDEHCAIVLMSAHSDKIETTKADLLDVELLSKPIPADVMNQILLDLPHS